MNLKKALVEGTHFTNEKEKFSYTRDSLEWTARDCARGRRQKTLEFVSKLPEIKTARRMIELGGGHGLFAIGFAQENPNLEVIVYDRPEIIGLTRDYIDKYGIQDRVRAFSGDYLLEDFGNEYDMSLRLYLSREAKERQQCSTRKLPIL